MSIAVVVIELNICFISHNCQSVDAEGLENFSNSHQGGIRGQRTNLNKSGHFIMQLIIKPPKMLSL